MDPTQLLAPLSPLGSPAPYWFLVLFKILGFTLHMTAMHLWYAGPVVALLLCWRGGTHAAVLSSRFMKQLPVIVAYGVNFGIVPLLFTQLAYYRVFYPATILMAWPWFSVFVLLTFAYYGVYLYAGGLHHQMTRFRQAAGWAAAVGFIVIGFLFANSFSLMTNVPAWPGLWESTSVAGAPTGTALNTADPTLWPRWLMMFGLALTTTAAYLALDAGVFAAAEGAAYRSWVSRFALKLYSVGSVWFAVTGAWYVFGTWQPSVRHDMFSGPLLVLTVLTAFSPGLPWLFLVAQVRAGGLRRGLGFAAAFAQFDVLAFNAVSRQVVQNLELRPFLDAAAEPVHMQWSPLLLFLALFVSGLAVILWMVRKVIAAAPSTPA